MPEDQAAALDHSDLGDPGLYDHIADKDAPEGDPPADDTPPGDKSTPPPARPAWMAQLPRDLQNDEFLAKHPKLEDVSRKLIELNGMREGYVKVPGKDATDEEKATYYKTIGRPETPDEYEFEMPEFPENMPQVYNEDDISSWKKTLHDAGLTREQANKVVKARLTEVIDAHAKLQRKRVDFHNEQVKALEKRYGDKYTEKTENAFRFVSQVGGKEFADLLDMTGMGDHPVMVDFFVRLQEAMGEDHDLMGGPGGGKPDRSPADKLFPEMAQKG